MSDNLLPCPFCGAEAIAEEVDSGFGQGGTSFTVGCNSSDEAACYGFQSLQTFSLRKDAIAGWNKRNAHVWCNRQIDDLTEMCKTLLEEKKALQKRSCLSGSDTQTLRAARC